MTNQETDAKTLQFKGPRDLNWRQLDESEGDDNQLKSDRDELHNTLLASLQMQNLVVLAGSGCSRSADGPSMSDLWDAVVGETPSDKAKAAAKAVGYDLAEQNIEALLSRVEASLQLQDNEDIKTFLSESKKIILDHCADFIEQDKLEAHKTFLHRLSRRRVRDQRLKLFTTNYDVCFERAAGALGSVALDGFSFAAPRRYDPRFFGYDIVRRPRNGEESAGYLEGVFLLYKLHGSVNWARKSDAKIVEESNPNPDEACLIYPAAGKYQKSYTQPHLESMAQYLAAVREPNTCVLIVGVGLNDDHLAEPLLSAARSNPHLRLIIVDPDANEKVENGNEHWKRFNELNAQGEDVWFVTADFAAFSQLIPDLKSLTPADALMKAVRGMTRE